MAAFPSPVGGASLILAFRPYQKTVVVIGSGPLAATRAFAALEADARVVVVTRGGADAACEELRWRSQQQQLTIIDLDALPGSVTLAEDRDAGALDTYLSTISDLYLVCVTDTLLGADPSLQRSLDSANHIARICRARRILVNVADHPELCDFTFTSTHRFLDTQNGLPTALQIGVTTNGQGCRLAGRLRRELVTKLSKDVGGAVTKIGRMRNLAKETFDPIGDTAGGSSVAEFEFTPNTPVPQRQPSESARDIARRRMRWVAQVSEYWPISRLASLSSQEIGEVLEGNTGLAPSGIEDNTAVNSIHNLEVAPVVPRGQIFLVGSGPGHPSLLTLATHHALTRRADLVLSDKLVPAAVLALIPSRVEVKIARKFPGNADGAQNELMEAAIEAANRGLTVVRLKQGDPSVYGRAGEEILYFRARGFEPIVIPGVSSVLAGPTFAGIPVTQRGAAESFTVCTGVGRQGKEVTLPGYERSRTLVILMGVARLPQVLETLLSESLPFSRRSGPAYPPNTPIALIERASMPDQRVVCTTLESISAAMESLEQRPPGMLIIGWSILSLWDKGDMTVLDDGAETRDRERILSWLGDSRWRIIDGLDDRWETV
ncbi:uroporphyrin-III C-methyltransferase [Cristinia sonorae]|uniref:precorrin-2 dehydrogenase n=1 Tax=Cristinia sonorae TaxID=1940300 RepID=A0A8K0XMZ6_9AGAR|nr:uroporphyrin-III C-methyltransferase [Cristinia sonorae]